MKRLSAFLLTVLIAITLAPLRLRSFATLNVTAAPYNATGDGSTDDTAAVQAALDDCTSADTVYFPAGTYSVNTLNVPDGCGVIDGDRGLSVLKARVSAQAAVLQAPGDSHDTIFQDLVIDMANLAHTGIKLENPPDGVAIRYCVFINGGSLGAVFIPNGMASGTPNTSIDHNIFKDIHVGIFSYGFFNHINVDDNYFVVFHQGISGGGCNPVGSGSNVTIDRNTFVQGRRMAIELCGRQNTISASDNYLTDWRPAINPVQCTQEQVNSGAYWSGACERYDICFGVYPYMCDSMGISLATGGTDTITNNNRIYRQFGTSWGIEFTAQGSGSQLQNNHIRESSVSIVDEACDQLNIVDNCATVRVNVTGNQGCGGFTDVNPTHFANWDGTNDYYSSCSNPSMPAMDSLPAMPFAYPVVGGGATRTQLSPFIIF
jgi:hypothetical protein